MRNSFLKFGLAALILAALPGGWNVWAVVKTKNLLAGYRFEEASGNVTDLSGNGFTGTATGTTVVTGHNGKGRSFNGTSDKISVADNASLRLSSAFTLSAWVNLSAIPAAGKVGVIIEKDDTSGNANYAFGISNNDGNYCTTQAWYVGFQNASATAFGSCSTASVGTGSWHHLAGTWDGTNLTIYVDGVLKTTTNLSGKTPTTGTGVLMIGNEAGNTFYISATLDELRVYNRALTASEVRSLMLGFEPGEF